MPERTLVERYNYDEFIPRKFGPWMRFGESPPLGVPGPDFSLWRLEGSEARLSDIWSAHNFTIIEFGSFT